MNSNKNNEHHLKASKNERLTQHEAPLVQEYMHTTDRSVGFLFSLFSRMVQRQVVSEQRPVAAVGASALEETATRNAIHYTKDINQQPTAKFNTPPVAQETQQEPTDNIVDNGSITEATSHA